MELAIRSYLREPDMLTPDNWPPAFDLAFAAPLRATLVAVLTACLEFAR